MVGSEGLKGGKPMHKFWRWEENSYKQNQKRKVLWMAAVICWMAALWVTYWIEHALYGEIIETGAFTYLGCSVGMAIGYCLRAGKAEEPISEKRRRVTNIIVTVLIAAFVIGLFYFKRIVSGTQFVCLILVAYWADGKMRKDLDKISLGACALFFASVMLVIGTFAGPKIMGLTSTKQAEKVLTAEGFSDVEYVHWLYGRWLYQDAVDKSFYEKGMKDEKYYLFEGEKDGENWRIVVAPKGGEIVIAATEKEEPTLADWI